MSILDKIKKNSSIKESAILSKSKFFNAKDMIQTSVPMLNVALSGSLSGGLTPGLTMLAANSRHFKSGFALLMAKAYLEKYPDAALLFYDSEFGTPQSYFASFDIDTDRVLHTPVTDVEQLKSDIMKQLSQVERGDHLVIVVDSIGNLASKKEVDDALEGKTVADMSRAKQIKSLFRMVTPHLNLKDIPMIAINHVYKEIGLYPKDIVSGGCVTKGTKIQLSNGDYKEVQDFVIGDIVETMDGPKNVTAVWNPETLENGTPECYEVEFDDGISVICSDTHKFLINGNWVEAKSLSTHDEPEHIEGKPIGIVSVKSIGTFPVYDISVADVEHYVLGNGVVTHNTGPVYSADTIFIIGRQQEKEGTEITGYNFIINIEKSRYVREKSKIPIEISFEGGISKWSGLLDTALESGHVIKPSNGWYSKVDKDTGEIEEKKYRAKDTDNKDFWLPIITSKSFQEFVESKYQISHGSIMQEEEQE